MRSLICPVWLYLRGRVTSGGASREAISHADRDADSDVVG